MSSINYSGPCFKTTNEFTVNSPNCDRSLFFRHEFGGILVYDFDSRLSTSITKIFEPPPEAEGKKGKIRGTDDYDRNQYEKMNSYTPMRQFMPKYTLVVPESNVLKFDSRFESGNLHKAIKLSENEYNLLLSYDTETQGHTQWYYFSVKPYKTNHTVRFNIINLMKFQSLYSEGMKPAVFSTYKKQAFNTDWHRDGFNLGYYQNAHKRKYIFPDTPKKYQFFYTLTFSYTFNYEDDEVFFAYSQPYTYSDLRNYLESLSNNEAYSKFLRINSFCNTLSGNECFMLTITNKIESYTGWKEESSKLNKSLAARRYMKLKESKEESKIKTTLVHLNGKS